MIANPASKYAAFKGVSLPDRQWPNRVIEKPPIWMSTDLRDGNQALIDPMSVQTKLRFFKELVAIGFKEIEIGFPSASDTDFEFTRLLIEDNHIPDDVTIEVLVQARYELIERTVESLRGAKRAILHIYNPIAPTFRSIVYNTDKAGVKKIAEQGARWVLELTAQAPEVNWTFQYSPEVFSSTEIEFAKEVSDAVAEIWQPTPQNKMILNLPATVEMSTPNTYADQIEWMHRNIQRRDSIILSVHPHNDRGTAVAAAELAVMAGADRVEGCLFGNGERTGNCCLVTVALNMYTQGIDPGLDFSDIDRIIETVEYCNQIPVHPRHPYGGELVFTAFSGSHQDAIKKGFEAHAQQNDERWRVPYLPIDPADLGRTYEAVIRVNSQSGKGGFAWVLEQSQGLKLPKKLQVDFSRHVQRVADELGRELDADDIWETFREAYYLGEEGSTFELVDYEETRASDGTRLFAGTISVGGKHQQVSGRGKGLVSSVLATLRQTFKLEIEVADYFEHALGKGADARAAAYLECVLPDGRTIWGVGIDEDVATASVRAILSAANAAVATAQLSTR